MRPLKITLDLDAQEILTFGELAAVFGPDGWYALRSPWKVVQELKCLRFQTSGGLTILLPCLEAWRFTFAFTSHLLTASVQATTGAALEEARAASTLTTTTGQTIPLPLTGADDHRAALITSGTLNLVVPDGFTHSDLTALAWLFTDERAFAAMTRFYSSVMAATTLQGQAHAARFSAPSFRLPFGGTRACRLLGLHHEETQTFLALHLARCTVKFPLPHTLTHDLAPASEPGPGGPDGLSPTPRYRGRRPAPPDDETKIDSLTPPDVRLTTLHLGLRQDRFGPLRSMAVRSRQEPEAGGPVNTMSGGNEPDTLVSGGEGEAGGRGGRQVSTVEQPPFVPPPSRPVNHFQQFCDLQGVCEALHELGIGAELLSLNRAGSGDPTTAIPTEAGTASTWVGQGIQARRVLVARLTWGEQVAYALEWERITSSEYGRLLLCSAGKGDLAHTTLLTLIQKCAERRGVWPETARGVPVVVGISHRKPYRTAMSAQIMARLRAFGWRPGDQETSPPDRA
ncbi:hypothetical protein IHN32_16880 [Deinococcus sp. 14RED07]|uniref:hypothetical protein n=1 Tax=Deinococcus sp. 14RED07 TaxID=2745874 RepID=UPI001E65A5A8|nr:hypothetical protein [Deinococcus sp. 14RED07]MCD0177614.1 hypothetical protein [Deinococcus sp. 14RED07]